MEIKTYWHLQLLQIRELDASIAFLIQDESDRVVAVFVYEASNKGGQGDLRSYICFSKRAGATDPNNIPKTGSSSLRGVL